MKVFVYILFFVFVCVFLDETIFETTTNFLSTTTDEKNISTTYEKTSTNISTSTTTYEKTSTNISTSTTTYEKTSTNISTSTTTLEKFLLTKASTKTKNSTTTSEKRLLASTTKDDGIFFVKQSLCFDSDGGLNTDVKGYVETKDGRYYDECVGKKVIEHYCSNNIAKTLEIICAHGCAFGVCQPKGTPATNTQI